MPAPRQVLDPGGRPGGRAGQQRERGAARHLGGRRDPAVGLHDQQDAAEPQRVEALGQRGHVAADDRADVGVEHRRARARVVADLREQVVRRGHVRVGELSADDLQRAPLVRRVLRRVQEGDRHGLHAVLAQRRSRRPHGRLVELAEHLPLRADALGDAVGPLARRERARRRQAVVVRRRARAVAQAQRVAEALGHERAGAGAVAGERRVRRDGRAVDDEVDRGHELGERHAEPIGDLLQAADEALRRVVRRRARLVHELDGVAEDEEVGERAADVDAEPVAHRATASRSRAVSSGSWPDPSSRTATPKTSRARPGVSSPSRTSSTTSPGSRRQRIAVARAAAVDRVADRPRRDRDRLLGAPVAHRAVGERQAQRVQPAVVAAEQALGRRGALRLAVVAERRPAHALPEEPEPRAGAVAAAPASRAGGVRVELDVLDEVRRGQLEDLHVLRLHRPRRAGEAQRVVAVGALHRAGAAAREQQEVDEDRAAAGVDAADGGGQELVPPRADAVRQRLGERHHDRLQDLVAHLVAEHASRRGTAGG